MNDTLTPAARSERMGRIRSKNTTPELTVRRMLHAMGYRFRLHRKELPGRPDIVLPRFKAAIFVHGCFWHQHPESSCKLSRLPKSRLDFWLPKLQGNRTRDLRNQEQLLDEGWKFLVIWECELRDGEALALKIKEFLTGHKCGRSSYSQEPEG